MKINRERVPIELSLELPQDLILYLGFFLGMMDAIALGKVNKNYMSILLSIPYEKIFPKSPEFISAAAKDAIWGNYFKKYFSQDFSVFPTLENDFELYKECSSEKNSYIKIKFFFEEKKKRLIWEDALMLLPIYLKDNDADRLKLSKFTSQQILEH